MNKVINPAQVANAMLNKMNGNSFMVMLNQIMTDAQANDVKIDRELRNDITQWQTSVNTKMGQLASDIERAEALAKLLEGGELTQIEEILRKLIDSDKMQALFAGMCVTVGDKSYKATSVIDALASAPDEVSGEVLYSADGSDITGYEMTLDDGFRVSFAATVLDDEEAGETSVEFAADDFKGVPAAFSQKFYRRTQKIMSFGTERELVSRDVKSVSHVLINLNAELCTGHADPVPDVDGDGDNTGADPVVAETEGLVNPLAQ